jgi:hypothetical protein
LARRGYRLSHFTKGTGASVEPLEEVRPAEPGKPVHTVPVEPAPRAHAGAVASSRLPPGHVRKKLTGEIGKVQAIDARAGTATVLWLRQGRKSTVRLSEVTTKPVA